MKIFIAFALFLAMSSSAQTFIDGGIITSGPITMVTPHGGTVTFNTFDYVQGDGGLASWLEIDNAAFVYVPNVFYTDDFSFAGDTGCISWATGYHGLCEDVGSSTFGTINLTIPYNVRVTGVLDAGVLLDNGQAVCITCPCP